TPERTRVTQVPQLPALQPKSIATECSSASSSSGDSLGSCRLGQVDIDDQRFGAGGLHRLRRLIQIGAVPGDEDERGEVTREANGRRATDALARAGDDGDRLRHAVISSAIHQAPVAIAVTIAVAGAVVRISIAV